MNTALSSSQPPSFLKLLAHDIRWKILVLLGRSDYCVQEIVRLLEQPQNLVSYHLRRLHDQNLVTERRSTADGRDIYYSLDVNTLRALYFAAGDSLNPVLQMWIVLCKRQFHICPARRYACSSSARITVRAHRWPKVFYAP